MEWMLSDREWARLETLLPKKKRPFRRARRKGGRPPLPDRRCFEAMLFVLFGGRWREVPKSHGSARAVLARIHLWQREGLLATLWLRYLAGLDAPRRWRLEAYFEYGPWRPRWEGALIASYRTAFSRRAVVSFARARFELRQKGLLRLRGLPKGSTDVDETLRRRYGARPAEELSPPVKAPCIE